MAYYQKLVTVAPTGNTDHEFDTDTIYLNSLIELIDGADSTTLTISYISVSGLVEGISSSANTLTIADEVGVKLLDIPHRGLRITPDGGGASNVSVRVVAWNSIGRH